MECTALNGQRVPQGETFVPGPDYCTMCKCDEGKAQLCRAVLCQPPQDCKYFRIGELCCDFICLDDMLPPIHDDGRHKGTSSDIGLRMVGSAITAILSLALLLFLIHRLRQRKRMEAQRRCFEDNADATLGVPPDSCHGNPCGHSNVYYENGEDLYFGMNSPTSPWKSHYFHYREPPPSYNEAVRNDSEIRACVASSESAFSSFPPMRPLANPVGHSNPGANVESSLDRLTTDLGEASSTSGIIENESGISLVATMPLQEHQNGAILSDQVYEEESACRTGQALNDTAHRGLSNNPSQHRTIGKPPFQILSLHNIESSQDVYYLERDDHCGATQSDL